MNSANIFAYFVFFSWPLVVLFLVFKYPTPKAVLLSILLAGMFLPHEFVFDLPGLPPINKNNITPIFLYIFLLLLGKRVKCFQSGIVTTLFIGYCLGIMITTLLNDDIVFSGSKTFPALTIFDGVTFIINTILTMMPFFLGRYYLNNLNDNEDIFKTLVFFALVYSLPMLLEVRISPQLHNLIYGYADSRFHQQIRSGGYRPTVFMGHGLTVAFWFVTCLVGAFALFKNKIKMTIFSNKIILLYLIIVLALTKTFGAYFLSLFAYIFIFKISPQKQAKYCFLLVILAMIYPIFKITGILPEQDIVKQLSYISDERSESLKFRFENETILLERALERPIFGWGGWDRNRVYNQWGNWAVTDGIWIILFGVGGIVGFLLYYLIITIPIYYAYRYMRYIQKPKEATYFSALVLILTFCILDSIPNSGMGSVHLLLAGALYGQAEELKKKSFLL